MPKPYEDIKMKLAKKGVPLPAAKTLAAKIYNANRKPGVPPVTRKNP